MKIICTIDGFKKRKSNENHFPKNNLYYSQCYSPIKIILRRNFHSNPETLPYSLRWAPWVLYYPIFEKIPLDLCVWRWGVKVGVKWVIIQPFLVNHAYLSISFLFILSILCLCSSYLTITIPRLPSYLPKSSVIALVTLPYLQPCSHLPVVACFFLWHTFRRFVCGVLRWYIPRGSLSEFLLPLSSWDMIVMWEGLDSNIELQASKLTPPLHPRPPCIRHPDTTVWWSILFNIHQAQWSSEYHVRWTIKSLAWSKMFWTSRTKRILKRKIWMTMAREYTCVLKYGRCK